jgi:signal transduction histidine kinase
MVRWRKILGPAGSLKRDGDILPCTALLEERTMWLITDNLIDNARKFSQGTPDITIRTHWKPGRLAGHWKIEFIDKGWGFNPKDAARIFGPFIRAKNPAAHAIPGNGLGLYLAASACKVLGLKLGGKSEGVGHGATFTIEGRASLFAARATDSRSEVPHAT